MLLSTLQRLYCFAAESTGHSWPESGDVSSIYGNYAIAAPLLKRETAFLLDHLDYMSINRTRKHTFT